MKRNEIIKHYKSFFGLEDMGMAEDDHLMIDWAEDLVKNCTIPCVTNRTCSNCHHCVQNPVSKGEHDKYKCFAREQIVTITNIENYVCDKWTSR